MCYMMLCVCVTSLLVLTSVVHAHFLPAVRRAVEALQVGWLTDTVTAHCKQERKKEREKRREDRREKTGVRMWWRVGDEPGHHRLRMATGRVETPKEQS